MATPLSPAARSLAEKLIDLGWHVDGGEFCGPFESNPATADRMGAPGMELIAANQDAWKELTTYLREKYPTANTVTTTELAALLRTFK